MNILVRIRRYIDLSNEYIGRGCAWLSVFMVVIQVLVVILRYVFSYGNIQLQESIWYMHGMLFMIGAGYTMLHNGHVRVDIVYRSLPERKKALVDLIGVIIFLMPICLLILTISWSYVGNSWAVMEKSIETSGLPFIYLLKSVILLFVLLLGSQGLSLAISSILTLKGFEENGAAAGGGKG